MSFGENQKPPQGGSGWTAERAKSYLATLPKGIADLFPDTFTYNQTLNKYIPEGWEIKTIKDMGDVVCGKTPSKSIKENYGGSVLFIKIPNMHNEVYVMQTDEYLTDLGVRSQKNKTIPKGSIAVSCIATVGKVIITWQESHTNQQINSIIPKKLYYRYFLYFKMLENNKNFHDLASGGSATLNMNTSTFSAVNLLAPFNELLKMYNKQVNSIFEKILENQKQTQTLTKLRDTLLPQLISGKLKVPEALLKPQNNSQ